MLLKSCILNDLHTPDADLAYVRQLVEDPDLKVTGLHQNSEVAVREDR